MAWVRSARDGEATLRDDISSLWGTERARTMNAAFDLTAVDGVYDPLLAGINFTESLGIGVEPIPADLKELHRYALKDSKLAKLQRTVFQNYDMQTNTKQRVQEMMRTLNDIDASLSAYGTRFWNLLKNDPTHQFRWLTEEEKKGLHVATIQDMRGIYDRIFMLVHKNALQQMQVPLSALKLLPEGADADAVSAALVKDTKWPARPTSHKKRKKSKTIDIDSVD